MKQNTYCVVYLVLLVGFSFSKYDSYAHTQGRHSCVLSKNVSSLVSLSFRKEKTHKKMEVHKNNLFMCKKGFNGTQWAKQYKWILALHMSIEKLTERFWKDFSTSMLRSTEHLFIEWSTSAHLILLQLITLWDQNPRIHFSVDLCWGLALRLVIRLSKFLKKLSLVWNGFGLM